MSFDNEVIAQKKRECITIQTELKEKLKQLAENDSYWKNSEYNRLTQQFSGFDQALELNFNYLVDAYKDNLISTYPTLQPEKVNNIAIAKAVHWLFSVIKNEYEEGDKTLLDLPASNLSVPLGFQEIHHIIRMPSTHINVSPYQFSSTGIWFGNTQEVSPLWTNYAKARAFWILLDKYQTLNQFNAEREALIPLVTSGLPNLSPITDELINEELTKLKEGRLDQPIIQGSSFFSSAPPLIFTNVNQYTVQDSFFSKILRRFSFFRLFIGSGYNSRAAIRNNLPPQQTTTSGIGKLVEMFNWVFNLDIAYPVLRYTFLVIKEWISELYQTILRPGDRQRLLGMIFTTLKLCFQLFFLPFTLLAPTIHGITSLPFTLIRALGYQLNFSNDFIKFVDCLDFIKDLIILIFVTLPFLGVIPEMLLPFIPELLLTVGYISSMITLSAVALVAGGNGLRLAWELAPSIGGRLFGLLWVVPPVLCAAFIVAVWQGVYAYHFLSRLFNGEAPQQQPAQSTQNQAQPQPQSQTVIRQEPVNVAQSRSVHEQRVAEMRRKAAEIKQKQNQTQTVNERVENNNGPKIVAKNGQLPEGPTPLLLFSNKNVPTLVVAKPPIVTNNGDEQNVPTVTSCNKITKY